MRTFPNVFIGKVFECFTEFPVRSVERFDDEVQIWHSVQFVHRQTTIHVEMSSNRSGVAMRSLVAHRQFRFAVRIKAFDECDYIPH